MTDKRKTIVVIESHEQTVIRRSRRVTTSQLVTLPATVDVQVKRKSPRRWWTTVALKSATVLAPLSRRLKTRVKEPKYRRS